MGLGSAAGSLSGVRGRAPPQKSRQNGQLGFEFGRATSESGGGGTCPRPQRRTAPAWC